VPYNRSSFDRKNDQFFEESEARTRMTRDVSALERARAAYQPRLPDILRRGIAGLAVEGGEPTASTGDSQVLQARFPETFGRPVIEFREGRGPGVARPLRVGVVLSGGNAPGGHNVIAGLFDALRGFHAESRVLGFLGGPRGILEAHYRELDAITVDAHRNTGGFDMIGSGRDKIETAEQFAVCRATCAELGLDGLVVIGGDDSNTNAAMLAEYFLDQGAPTAVVGVPKTIDGDLKGEHVEASFGVDTATKVYSELIGNICRDARSSAKYWHFVKLMGRSASHVTLECALQTHANVVLIGEEVREKATTLKQIVEQVAGAIRRRATAGRSYGVCLVPEGLIEFIPEMRSLIDELNTILAAEAEQIAALETFAEESRLVTEKLSAAGATVFGALPERIQRQLLLDRDAHGNVQVSKIDTESLLTEQVGTRIAEWKSEGKFNGSFKFQTHFFGYEGRCAAPSNFDADYTYGLGHVAAALIGFGKTGYMCSIRDLAAPTPARRVQGVPLTSMMQIEMRKGRPVPVIAKALVRTDAGPFGTFAASRDLWEREDDYVYPGAIQYFGPSEVGDRPTLTLRLERGK
jgi:pyrophosphate--fructose-6-phosphate 1-phosphotransferase